MMGKFVFACLTICLVGASDYDLSVEQMCLARKGTFEKRGEHEQGRGDICKNIRILVATEDDVAARQLCESQIPLHITGFVRGPTTTECSAETGFMCKKGWTQLYGRCYQLSRKSMTYSEAHNHCSSSTIGGQIAFMHREYIINHFKNIQERIPKMWLTASESIRDRLVFGTGDKILFVIDGSAYRVPSGSLVKSDGETDKAMVLCEYTPVMTLEESGYLVRRYSEIYWTGFTNEEGMFMRTAGFVNHNRIDTRADETYCQKAMKPYLKPSGNRFSGAYPSEQFMTEAQKLTKKNLMTFFRTPARLAARGAHRRNVPTCQTPEVNVTPLKNGFFIELRQPDTRPVRISNVWTSGQPKVPCDVGFWSTAVRALPGSTKLGMETFSDARFAPMYCQAYLQGARYGDCPTGWKPYERRNGVKWCHKHFGNPLLDEKASMDHCAKEGAKLDGYDDTPEYQLMKQLLKDNKNKLNCMRNRLGGKRRKECMWTDQRGEPVNNADGLGYDKNPESTCSRRNVFQWQDGVASDPPGIGDENWTIDSNPAIINPSYSYKGVGEICLEHMEEDSMNDIDCNMKTCFFCGKEAPVEKM